MIEENEIADALCAGQRRSWHGPVAAPSRPRSPLRVVQFHSRGIALGKVATERFRKLPGNYNAKNQTVTGPNPLRGPRPRSTLLLTMGYSSTSQMWQGQVEPVETSSLCCGTMRGTAVDYPVTRLPTAKRDGSGHGCALDAAGAESAIVATFARGYIRWRLSPHPHGCARC